MGKPSSAALDFLGCFVDELHGLLAAPFGAKKMTETLGAAPPELQVIQSHYLDSVGVLASIANKWILRQSLPTGQTSICGMGVMVPLARRLDPLLGYQIGKSVIAIWRLRQRQPS